MKRLLILIIIALGIALACPVLAQPAPNAGGMEPGGVPAPGTNRSRMRSTASGSVMLIRAYSPKTVTTVKGVVQSLRTMPFNSQAPGAVLAAVLKTDQGDLTIYLAPAEYLSQLNISPKAGDEVEVTGSKVTLGKQSPSIIVKELKVGGKSAAIRNERGVPLWLAAQTPSGASK